MYFDVIAFWIASQARNDGRRASSLRGTKQSGKMKHANEVYYLRKFASFACSFPAKQKPFRIAFAQAGFMFRVERRIAERFQIVIVQIRIRNKHVDRKIRTEQYLFL